MESEKIDLLLYTLKLFFVVKNIIFLFGFYELKYFTNRVADFKRFIGFII